MTSRTGYRVVTFLTCSVLPLTACSSNDGEADSSAAKPEASSSSKSPDAPSPSGTAPTSTATCKLKGKAGGRAKLEQNGDGLVMSFSGLPVPSIGDVLYTVTAFDEAGESGGQIGAKFQDGQQIAYFVFDFGSAGQTNLDGSVDLSRDTLTAAVTDADLGPLSGVDVASWSAAYSVNGTDVGRCPGGIDPLPFPS